MKEKLNSLCNRYPNAIFGCLFVLFVSVEALFSFCTTIECPAFHDENFIAWFPYERNQTIYFETVDGKKETITITARDKSEVREVASSNGCNSWIQINARSGDETVLDLHYDVRDEIKSLYLSLYRTSFYAEGFSEAGPDFSGTGEYAVTQHPSLTLDGFTFADVLEVQADSVANAEARTNSDMIRRIWLAKNEGLIAFEKYGTNSRWVKRP